MKILTKKDKENNNIKKKKTHRQTNIVLKKNIIIKSKHFLLWINSKITQLNTIQP